MSFCRIVLSKKRKKIKLWALLGCLKDASNLEKDEKTVSTSQYTLLPIKDEISLNELRVASASTIFSELALSDIFRILNL